MLSFRVKALLQIGQCTLFSPVCFFPWRAAWPEVVNVAEQLWLVANGQGYLFFRFTLAVIESLDPLIDAGGDGGSETLLALSLFSAVFVALDTGDGW
jgi:hypothetical protein